MTAEDTRYSATMAWVEGLILARPELQATRHEFATASGMLWVLVEGGDFEVLAWRAAVGGRIMPSKVVDGVWAKEVLSVRVHVRVTDDPRKRGA
jgi:hypothetical protein